MPTCALVTGASGFVGKNLVKRLLQDDEVDEVVGISRRKIDDIQHSKFINVQQDLLQHDNVKQLFKFYKPTHVFHLAANPLIKLSPDNPCKIIDDNIKITHILAHYSDNIQKFVYFSSASVYGNLGYYDYCFESTHCLPNSIYGITKMTGEYIVNCYKTNSLIFRPIAMVGKEVSHGLLFDVIRKLRADSAEIELFGTCPGTIKPFVHIDDVVEAVYIAYKQDLRGIYNISMPEILSVLDVATIAMETLNIHKPIKWSVSGLWSGDNHIVKVNSDKIRKTGWSPKYNSSQASVEQAVKEIACIS